MRVRFWVEGFARNNKFVSYFLKITIEPNGYLFAENNIYLDVAKNKNDATIVESSNVINRLLHGIYASNGHILRAIMENVDTGEITEIV